MFEINIDYKKTFSWVEFKKTMSRVENIAALFGLLGLFLPYASRYLGFAEWSEIGYIYFYRHESPLLVIPLLLLTIVFIRPTCKNKTRLKLIKLISGVFIVISSIYIFFQDRSMGIGFYIVLLSGIVILLGALDKFQLKNALPPINELATEDIDSNEDK